MRRAAALCALLAVCGAGAANASADTVSATLTRADLPYRSATQLDGHLLSDAGAPIGGAAVTLQASPYPYRSWRTAAQASTAADGTFGFPGLIPDRNTRYRVAEAAGPQALSPVVAATVQAPAVTHLYHLRYGFQQATVLSYHNAAFNWGGMPAYWFIAKRGDFHWHLMGVTHTHERRAGLTYMTLTFLPPKGHFAWRVCFNAPNQAAYGPPTTHGPCPHGDFKDRVPAP